MPAFRRGGPQPGRGRGRGGQARGGGPRLPSAITDELGLPSQKKSKHIRIPRVSIISSHHPINVEEFSRPYDKDEKFTGKRPPHASGTNSGTGLAKKPSFNRRPQDEGVERPTKRFRAEESEQIARSVPQAKVALPDRSEAPVDDSLSFLPHTGEGPRKKLAPTASTALSRMLAKQKGSKRVQETVEQSDEDESMQDEDTSAAAKGSSKISANPKQKKAKRSTVDSEAPLDPSIMESAFGSGRGKKAEKDEEQEIAWLEWKLGKKGAKKPTTEEGDESDGLDGKPSAWQDLMAQDVHLDDSLLVSCMNRFAKLCRQGGFRERVLEFEWEVQADRFRL